MPKLTFLPNPDICPEGMTVSANKGDSICKVALQNGIKIEHACEMSCACTTCHIYITKGYDSLEPPTDDEDDYLDNNDFCVTFTLMIVFWGIGRSFQRIY